MKIADCLKKFITVFVFAALALAPSANGQLLANRLITDLNPGGSGSYPTNLYVYKSCLFFSATTTATGRELWGFNGTNVSLVSNINSTVTDAGGGLFIGNDSSPNGFATYSNKLYFSAFEPVNGDELWRYDGTNAARVTDINSGSGNAFPQQLTVMSNELFFTANNGTSKPNYELWKYNGISATMVANIHSDSGGSDFSSYPTGLTVFNGALYFMADDGSHGYELWKATSTSATLLQDINPGNAGSDSFPKYFTAYKNKLYFQAFNSTSGTELWQTDGTNTSRVADLNPGTGNSDPQYFTVFKNALYFQANDGTNGYELWKYDGTILSLVSNINLTGDSFPQSLTVFSNYLCFAATDGIHGWELWKYDGTNASLVVDLNPAGDSFPGYLTVFNGALYFVANTADTGYEWWLFDGNTVKLAADINPGSGSSYPQAPAVYNGTLCFSATIDGVSDWEPWQIWTAPFQITSIQPTNSSFTLTWQTAGGTVNVIQSADDLSGPFSNLSDPITIPGSGNTNASYTDTPDVPQRFYRVIQP
jgi:ELWxxDGT repeat protein